MSKKKKNEGIIMVGGEINSSNISIGKDAQININSINKQSERNEIEKNQSLKDELLSLLAANKVEDVITKLIEYFKNKKLNSELKEAVMQSASFHQTQLQERLNTSSHGQLSIDKAKINSALIEMINRI
jgi:hypothetical protein